MGGITIRDMITKRTMERKEEIKREIKELELKLDLVQQRKFNAELKLFELKKKEIDAMPRDILLSQSL